jgi:hypothetical protein
MPRTRTDDDDNPFDQFGILKDGARVRVPLQMRDSADGGPLSPAELARRMQLADSERRRRGPVVTDAAGDSLFGIRKPGFRYLQGGSVQDQRHRELLHDAVVQARADYIRDLEAAWKTPQPATTTGSLPYAEPQVGGPCSKDGYSGVWEIDEETGELCCRIDRRATGNCDGRSLPQLIKDRAAVMEPLYEQVARELSQAWQSK